MTRSKQATLQVPSTPTYKFNAPIIETTQSHLEVPTAYINVPHTETHQTSLEVPHEVTTQGHVSGKMCATQWDKHKYLISPLQIWPRARRTRNPNLRQVLQSIFIQRQGLESMSIPHQK